MRRRLALAAAVAALMAAVPPGAVPVQAREASPSPSWSTVTPLREAVPWPVGVAIDAREMSGTADAVVSRRFDQVTAENAMKPAGIWRDPSVTDWRRWDWSQADAYVDHALARGLRLYGHTLLWHHQMPAWFYRRADGTPFWNAAERRCIDVTAADRDLMRSRITTWIEGAAAHFRSEYGEFGSPGNPIVAFDVVNEAIDNSPDHFRQVENPLYCALGPAYLEHALHVADAALRGADGVRRVKLFINDYNTEWSWKSDDQLAVVEDLLARGVPLDGVGHQLHLSLADGPTLLQAQHLRRTLDQIRRLGLEQAITELDVGIVGDSDGDGVADTLPAAELADRLAAQGRFVGDLFALLRTYDLFSVSVWGLHDARTWRVGARPLLFDADLGVKPALLGSLERAPRITADLPAAVSVVDGGELTLEVQYDAHPEPEVTWQLRDPDTGAWSTVQGPGSAALLLLPVDASSDGASYRALVENARGRAVSSTARVDVVPRPPRLLLEPPTIGGGGVGIVAVGTTLVADPGAWEPAPTTVDLQWLRSGRPVAGATGTAYRVGRRDVGERLSVVAAVSGPGAPTAQASSSPTAVVRRAATYLDVRAREVDDRGRVRLRILAEAAGTGPDGLVVVRDGRQVLASVRLVRGRAVATVRVVGPARRGLVVRYRGNAWARPATTRTSLGGK